MKFSKLLWVLVVLFIFSKRQALADKKTYIVYMGGHSHGSAVTSADLHRVTNSHVEFLSSFLESQGKAKDAIFYSYTRHINGFAAILEEDEAANIAKHPGVVSVFPDGLKKLHTTHSWDFLGLEKHGKIHRSSLWKRAKFGEDVIIANLDTGVWPESRSFSDHGYGPIPSKWKGMCVNNTKSGVPCNRKLIGARYYNKGYISIGGNITADMNTPRDDEGHGTHTLSTAAGNFVEASIFGEVKGIAKGGSPRARVAAYKVCWLEGCADSDILQGFDDAIADGVDVISVSLGGEPVEYYLDSLAMGSFHAVKNNVVVVASAGNDGPYYGSVSNGAPWIITVGASTMDRRFQTTLVMQNGVKIQGESLSKSTPGREYYPLIRAIHARKNASVSESDTIHCETGTLDPKKVKGKIVVCLRGGSTRVEKGFEAFKAGAVGVILCNDDNIDASDLESDPHFLPAVHITYDDSLYLFKYMNSTRRPTGYITATVSKYGIKPSPATAFFSSRGPGTVTPDILKPDITAPGVSILASFAEDVSPTGLDYVDHRRTPFNILSGTSMSCPHVSGVVGLIKSVHPDWSPAAIRSAIMTTARTRDNTGHPIVDDNVFYNDSSPLIYGAGLMQPNRAMDPGLIYDLTLEDHLNYFCARGYAQTLIFMFAGKPYECPKDSSILNFNYPSITVYQFTTGILTLWRRLKNVGAPGTYTSSILHPPGILVSVEPEVLHFGKIGEEKSFKLILEGRDVERDPFVFGTLIWTDGHHYVKSPIMVSNEEESKDNLT